MSVYENAIIYHARAMSMFHGSISEEQFRMKFVSYFGTSPFVCSEIYRRIIAKGQLCHNFKPMHLLWCLLYMKTYVYETVLSGLFQSDCKTIRKWVWYAMEQIANIADEVVSISACYFP
jgi:hypothetical protein